MLHEELTRVRKFIAAMRDPDADMELRMNADNAELVEMILHEVAARVRDLELSVVPLVVLNGLPEDGKVISLAEYKSKTPKKRNAK